MFNPEEAQYSYEQQHRQPQREDGIEAVLILCQFGFCFSVLLFSGLIARQIPFFSIAYICLLVIALGLFGFGAWRHRGMRWVALALAAFLSVIAAHWDGVAGSIQSAQTVLPHLMP